MPSNALPAQLSPSSRRRRAPAWTSTSILGAVLFSLFVWGTPLTAQSTPGSNTWNPSGLTMDRESLQRLEDRFSEIAQSPAYSDPVRQRARRDAAAIDERLTQGDFRTGDRIVIDVEGEEQIPDTLFVESGPQVTFPVMGTISLAGVLRSELNEHLTEELARFIQEPIVRSRALMRLSILGSVGSPGFYNVPADVPLGDALMRAGGPTRDSAMEELRIESDGEIYLDGEELQNYLADGRTLDQLNLQAGDQIVLPQVDQSSWWTTPLRWGAVIASSLLLGVRVF